MVKKMNKKLFTASIIVIFLIGILPLTAYCQDEETPPAEETPPPEETTTPPPSESPTPTTSESPTPTTSGSPTPTSSTSPSVSEEPTSSASPGKTKRPTATRTPRSTGAAVDWMFIAEVGLGVALLGGSGVFAFVFVKKRGVSEKSLRNRSSSEFQAWVLKKLEGRSASSADSALGIDGFSSLGQPLAIKQSEGVGMNTIDLFASSLAKSRAKNGVIVAFSFSDDAVRGKVRARRNYGLDIQMVTVQELINSRRPLY